MGMTEQLTRPEMKTASAKITEEDMAYFSLGIDKDEFILPSKRPDYTSDPKAVALVEAVKAGKDLSGQDFSGVNLIGADLSGAKLSGANFSGAVFYKTTAKNCDFSGSDFSGAYMEDFDAESADFSGVKFHHVFARRFNFKNAKIDPNELKKLNALEHLIELIEAGQIDIHCLSKQDLMHLDLRRLDLSKVDLEGIDLSAFVLEGINLCGTYIDPKQLMSLEGLQHYHRSVAKMNEQKIKTQTLKVVQSKMNELAEYAKREKQAHKLTPEEPVTLPPRPPFKGHKNPTKITSAPVDAASEEASKSPHKIAGKPGQTKQVNLKNRN